MSIFHELREVASNVSAMVLDLAASMKSQRDAGSYRAQDLFRAFIVGTGGPSGVGASGDISATDLGNTNSVYLHMKLPLKNTDDKVEFNFLMEGYNYGGQKLINVTWAGHINAGVLVKDVTGTHVANAYIDANGNVVLSIFFASIYYTTFNMECLSHIDNKRVTRGQIQAVVSLSSQVNF